LDGAEVAYVVNPRLVRGLDYYARTVFEWVTDRLGAQGTVCAGGRYDGLVEQLGGRSTPAIGFAMGVERLISLLEEVGSTPAEQLLHAYLVLVGDEPQRQGVVLAEKLRDEVPGLQLLIHCGGGSFKSQFKKADRSGALLALVLGDDELARGVAGVKYLRQEAEQQEVALEELADFLQREVVGS
jgi:histidyl-tRNA synthetase